MSHYQISSRQYYIITLASVALLILIALIAGQVTKKIKADNVLPNHLPEIESTNNTFLDSSITGE